MTSDDSPAKTENQVHDGYDPETGFLAFSAWFFCCLVGFFDLSFLFFPLCVSMSMVDVYLQALSLSFLAFFKVLALFFPGEIPLVDIVTLQRSGCEAAG